MENEELKQILQGFGELCYFAGTTYGWNHKKLKPETITKEVGYAVENFLDNSSKEGKSKKRI